MKDFNKISDFIDGDLSPAEQVEFEQSEFPIVLIIMKVIGQLIQILWLTIS